MGDEVDVVVLGAGIAGLYAADLLTRRKRRVVHLERDPSAFTRASRINQQRVHLGHHYPRSMCTAAAAARSFARFTHDFRPAISCDHPAIYGIAARSSSTSARQFRRFCDAAGIAAREINPARHFQHAMVEAAFETDEATFDPQILGDLLLHCLEARPSYERRCGVSVQRAERGERHYRLTCSDGSSLTTSCVLNCTYAGVNAVLRLFSLPALDLKYELSEVALCRASGPLRSTGITVLDGPFFSALPTGQADLHTLTAVEYTPHRSSSAPLPSFSCQQQGTGCSPSGLQPCDACDRRPASAFVRMRQMARKFLTPESDLTHVRSHFTIKTILRHTEVDDARPTAIFHQARHPDFLTVLTGKVDAIYDMERVIDGL